ncbi:hypothetical protein ANN_16768 [Periplaneta americana]|uniref:Uncharacterized protein n=1 Tax=Periplaneta americana TaxID=6978 RepID=A0ABQ8SSG4_PERAM|nr:hypothetical protein ANN_16768 [Periplaneta americana]
MAGLCEGGNEPPGSLKAKRGETEEDELAGSRVEKQKMKDWTEGCTGRNGEREKNSSRRIYQMIDRH